MTCTRRQFLFTTAAAAAVKGPPVIDTHMHVWSADTARFPFAHPYDPKFKPPPVAASVEMLVEELDRNGIDGCVLVQVIYYGWDNRYVAECAKRHPRRFRAQGLIDPTDPQVAQKLDYWVREHGLSGMRFSPMYYRGKDEWMTSAAHHALWKKAQELRAVFNFFIAAPQLPKLDQMAARYPRVQTVIDHFARVDLAASDAEQQIKMLVAMAHYPNVSAKVSELNIISPNKIFPYKDTWPMVRRVYDAFGPDRLLWGTGFPGATREQAGRPTLERELALIQEIPFFTARDREKILGANAARIWRFTGRPR